MTDRDYMERAIALARKGLGRTNPNPLVGAVIVKDGRIIGEGWHDHCGGPHAERSAIASLTESAEGSTLYVTLEPCCHWGRTPPCTDAILEQKIGRVVIGSRDPNPKVSGKGAALLRSAGVQVEEDFLRKECDSLNPVFFHYITTQTPYVIMKYAMTADGKIATRTGASKWITGEAARQKVQELRRICPGIMAGIGTVLADDPLLTVREENARSPVRIICDSRLRIPPDCRICRTAEQYPTILACAAGAEKDDPAMARRRQQLERRGLRILETPARDGHIDLNALMRLLGAEGIDAILLEGGGTLNESALRSGIVQELQVFVAPKIFGGNGKSPVEGEGVALPSEALGLELRGISNIGGDLLLRYQIRSRSAGKEALCSQES